MFFISVSIRLFGYPASLNGIGVPFPLSSEMSNPCETQINCPLDKNNKNSVENFKIGVPLDGVLALVIPQGETVKLVVEVNAVDALTNEEEKLGVIDEMNFSIIEADHEAVVNDIQKTTLLGRCNDREIVKLPVADLSSNRISVRSFEQDEIRFRVKFHVIEDFVRRSFGSPELTASLDGNSVEIDEKSKYPCSLNNSSSQGSMKSRLTCGFKTISKLKNRENRLYTIDLLKSSLVISDNKPDSVLRIRLQGNRKRAYAEFEMKLGYFLNAEVFDEILVQEPKITETVKTSRGKRWSYDIDEYNRHLKLKVQQNTHFSSSTASKRINVIIYAVGVFLTSFHI